MINQLWAKYDTDHSGQLDFRESKRFVTEYTGGIPDDIFLQVFNKFDKDDSGTIAKYEMVYFINDLTEGVEEEGKAD